MGLPLATLTEAEATALQELARCKMSSIIGERPLLIGGGNKLCNLQKSDGTSEESDVSDKSCKI